MYYLTELIAIDPQDQELKIWAGPRIWAESKEKAEEYCQRNGLGFCKVIGEFDSEINDRNESIIWMN